MDAPMSEPLIKGDKRPEVIEMQKLLVERGYQVEIDGDFGSETYRAVRAIQSQNIDQHGLSLVVDEGDKRAMPFVYCPGAIALLKDFKDKGMGYAPNSGYDPKPGDIVVWWREKLIGWKGHVGLVHQLKDGMLYTIEGNKSPNVQGFSYVFSRMDKLLVFGHVPDA